MRYLLYFILASGLLLGALGMPPPGPRFAPGEARGWVTSPLITEDSGLVASRRHADVLWVHNDSGGFPKIFAIDTRGRLLGSFGLAGATHVDYEDIALGPGPDPGVDYLYVADIGDSTRNRDGLARPKIVVYRVKEPPVVGTATNPIDTDLQGVVALTLSYPGNRQYDAEVFMVDPWTGDFYLATKQWGKTAVFRAASETLNTQIVIQLTHVVDLVGLDLSVAGDISVNGEEILIKTYFSAKLWRRFPGQSVADALVGDPINVPVRNELQGEAIGFDRQGKGYFTHSENAINGAGPPQPLFYYRRLE